ncbi:hypothetical protein [Rhodoferax sp.]|uniref:hypothetical protein n=1 Tax=Rhodoferax sp. TaxID=50421 RepID=UPI00374DAF5A
MILFLAIRRTPNRLRTLPRKLSPSEALALCSSGSLIITIGINFPKLNEDKERQAHRAWGSSF